MHGSGATEVRAADLTLDKFIDAQTLAAAPALPRVNGTPQTVLLTGANGYWELRRRLARAGLDQTGGKLITHRAGHRSRRRPPAAGGGVRQRGSDLLERFRTLAADHLEIVAGDIGEPNLGLDQATWDRLADSVDLIVSPGGLATTAAVRPVVRPQRRGHRRAINLAITTRIKPITYLSTVSVVVSVDPGTFNEDGDIRGVSSLRAVDDSYANGYGNSKWAGEVLLREAHDLCGLPVAVFRSDLILAHSQYAGQLNVPDMFTRLIFTCWSPVSRRSRSTRPTPEGNRAGAHYDGLPADFVAESVNTLGEQMATRQTLGTYGPST